MCWVLLIVNFVWVDAKEAWWWIVRWKRSAFVGKVCVKNLESMIMRWEIIRWLFGSIAPNMTDNVYWHKKVIIRSTVNSILLNAFLAFRPNICNLDFQEPLSFELLLPFCTNKLGLSVFHPQPQRKNRFETLNFYCTPPTQHFEKLHSIAITRKNSRSLIESKNFERTSTWN
jgi:hypothetical protein